MRQLPLVLVLVLAGCPTAPTWQGTCGDPVCGGHTDQGVPACTNEVEGAECAAEGDRCDPGNDCNALLECTAEDLSLVECPISLRAAKTEIHYLDDAERDGVAEAALHTRLATWRYNDEPPGSKPHLGFIIDDLPAGSPAVRSDGAHVDLYGWMSMNAAALQRQQEQIAALQARVEELEKKLAARP